MKASEIGLGFRGFGRPHPARIPAIFGSRCFFYYQIFSQIGHGKAGASTFWVMSEKPWPVLRSEVRVSLLIG